MTDINLRFKGRNLYGVASSYFEVVPDEVEPPGGGDDLTDGALTALTDGASTPLTEG